MYSEAITSSNESHLGIIVGDSMKTSVQCVAAIKQENNTSLSPKWAENNWMKIMWCKKLLYTLLNALQQKKQVERLLMA